MADDLGALTILGESADWLKAEDGASVRDRRIAALEAYRAAWVEPENDGAHSALRASLEHLIEALRHNHLYPDSMVLGAHDKGASRHMSNPESLRADFDQLGDFLVVNRFGIGEAHLLYVVFLLYRTLHQTPTVPYDHHLENAVCDVIDLRVPIYRADNLAPFSAELHARFHAVRLVRAMMRLGLVTGSKPSRLTSEDHAEIASLLADKLRPVAATYILKPHDLPFGVLETASALESFSRAHAANRAPADDRPPEELFSSLRHALRRLARHTEVPEASRERMQNLGVAAIARTIAHVDRALGKRMYTYLRKGSSLPTVRHSRMFKLLPNNAERLAFVNFLYMNATQNPVYYIKRFEPFFEGQKLRFVRKEIGFHLVPAEKDE